MLWSSVVRNYVIKKNKHLLDAALTLFQDKGLLHLNYNFKSCQGH